MEALLGPSVQQRSDRGSALSSTPTGPRKQGTVAPSEAEAGSQGWQSPAFRGQIPRRDLPSPCPGAAEHEHGGISVRDFRVDEGRSHLLRPGIPCASRSAPGQAVPAAAGCRAGAEPAPGVRGRLGDQAGRAGAAPGAGGALPQSRVRVLELCPCPVSLPMSVPGRRGSLPGPLLELPCPAPGAPQGRGRALQGGFPAGRAGGAAPAHGTAAVHGESGTGRGQGERGRGSRCCRGVRAGMGCSFPIRRGFPWNSHLGLELPRGSHGLDLPSRSDWEKDSEPAGGEL